MESNDTLPGWVSELIAGILFAGIVFLVIALIFGSPLPYLIHLFS